MDFTRKQFLALAAAGATSVGALCACSPQQKKEGDSSKNAPASVDLEEFKSLTLDMGAWSYDKDNDVYYQLGLQYCMKPASKTYNSLSIYVPGKYFTGEKNSNKTYTCKINTKAVVGSFTPSTAPIAMPINTGTLSPQACPTEYSYEGLSTYLETGCIYVYAGFRGRSAGYDSASGSDDLYAGGSPWPAVDFKAAIRYLRYNAASLPCDAAKVFAYGFSSGGGLSAVLGTSGDSPLYSPYLDAIGAATHDTQGTSLSDAIYGSASWCPSTSFDVADAAYEWSAGQYADGDTRASGTWTHALSSDLATAYGTWVNSMDLLDSDGNKLELDQTNSGVYTMGSYMEIIQAELETSANNFARETSFPYTATPQRFEDPLFPGDPNLAKSRGVETPSAVLQTDATKSADAQSQQGQPQDQGQSQDQSQSQVQHNESSSSSSTGASATGVTQVQSTIFDSIDHYFESFNEKTSWLTYNLHRQTVSIANLKDFSAAMRPASLGVGAFDAVDRNTRANQLFGVGEKSTLHFDKIMGDLVSKNVDTYGTLTGWNKEYAEAWKDDLALKDTLESDIPARVSLFNPLYFISGTSQGFATAQVAPYWRINEGVQNSDTSICTSLNMKLALTHYKDVKNVAFTLVWDKGHVLAERTGNVAANLVNWIVACATA